MVVSYFHPFASGAEKQALAQGVELARRGHSVRVLTRAVPGYPVDDEEYRGVQIHRWIRTVDRGPLFGLSFVAGLTRILRRLRGELDVVHTHQALWEAVATGVARHTLRGVPTLAQPASSGYYGEAQELMRTRGAPLLRRLILRNTHFAAISDDVAREWLDLGVPPDRLTRTASGVDTDAFRPGASAAEAELLPRPRAVFTGRLHPQKNLPLLLNAWVEVARRSPANLILVGPGSDREALMELSRSLGIADRVQFVGAVPSPAEHLRAADLFVLPSVAEGMSNSLLEAMATGLPCVVSGVGGNTDLIAPGSTGVLVPDPTPEAWSAALLALINSPEEARHLGRNALARIEDEFSLRAVVDRYVGLYRELIAKERGRG
ncbi:MAG: glycosyltransferase [Planctomycetales bacterium 71-10]|nr:MAG: glycosyltransferase [Planctomycetales bacterium 71-10]